MATDSNESASGGPSPRREGYEQHDANARWIFVIIGGFLLLLLGAELLLKRAETALSKQAPPTDAWSGARRALKLVTTQGSFPRLQISPPEDLRRFRAREDAELNSYGWVDKTAGVVRIPVQRAMDLALQQGLPVRPGIGRSRLGPTPFELQQQRTNTTQREMQLPR